LAAEVDDSGRAADGNGAPAETQQYDLLAFTEDQRVSQTDTKQNQWSN
jgi:hypothetical protein